MELIARFAAPTSWSARWGAGKDGLLDTHRFPHRRAAHLQIALIVTHLSSSVDETHVIETWSSGGNSPRAETRLRCHR